jgi:hypothetical protein
MEPALVFQRSTTLDVEPQIKREEDRAAAKAIIARMLNHFNVETPFDALVGRGLAIGGVVFIVLIAALTFAAFRPGAIVPISLRLVFADERVAAYTTGGILKPTHAVTMHGILVLPLLAWRVSFANVSEQRRLTIVLLAAAGYLALIAVVAVESFARL